MISNQDEKESYSLSVQDKKRLKGILDERKTPNQNGGQGCDQGEIPSALEDEIGLEIMEYILEDDDQYLSSQKMAENLETDPSTLQVGHRIRMIGDSLGVERDDVSQFYSSNTTWDLDKLRDNSLDQLYEEARGVI